MPKPWLVMMTKAPVAGRVKTRLARSVGVAEALRFYRHVGAATIRGLARDPRWHFVLGVAPDPAVRSGFWPGDVRKLPQGQGDLGARMQRVFDRFPGRSPIAIIGSDVPGITPAHIARAFRLLGRADVVLGPSDDGGYWLVGAKRRPHVPRLFRHVRWSSTYTLDDTLANLSRYAIGFCDRLNDVDEAAEFKLWRRGDLP